MDEQPTTMAEPADVPCSMQEQEEPCCSGRLDMLRTVFTKCLKHGLRQPGLQAIASRFPNLPEPVIVALHDLYRQVLQHVELHSQDEFAHVCQEHDIEARLAELDALAITTTPGSRQPCQEDVRQAQAQAWLTAKQQEETHLSHQLEEASMTRQKLQELLTQREALAHQLAQEYQSAVSVVTKVMQPPTEPLACAQMPGMTALGIAT